MLKDEIMISKAKSMENYIWTCGGFAVDEDDVWFVPYWENVLCRYSFVTEKIEDIIAFPDASVLVAASYNVKQSDKKIIVIPAFEKKVYIYDKTKKQMEKIELSGKDCSLEKFKHCIIYKNNAYIFPIGEDYIVKIDLMRYKVDEIENPIGKMGMYVDYAQIEKNVYLVNLTEEIIAFDLENEKFSICAVGNMNGKEKYRTISIIQNNKLFLTDICGNICVYNLQTEKVERRIYNVRENIDYSLTIQDKVYLFPHDSGMPIIRCDCNNWTFTEISFWTEKYENSYINAFSEPELVNNYIYVMNTYEESVCVLNIDCTIVGKYKIKMMEINKEVAKALFDCGRKQGKIYERPSAYATLEYYCSSIERSSYQSNDMLHNIGKEIYESIGRL